MDDKIHNSEIFSSGGATLYKNPSDQTVWSEERMSKNIDFNQFCTHFLLYYFHNFGVLCTIWKVFFNFRHKTFIPNTCHQHLTVSTFNPSITLRPFYLGPEIRTSIWSFYWIFEWPFRHFILFLSGFFFWICFSYGILDRFIVIILLQIAYRKVVAQGRSRSY